ncbi:hypothetical protein BDF20DRAFT_871856 [Mycotypha africana]|uniref:uncharacterized protein n=1 Tax=Mycotypha africana TaxID=64632 RepID=UPI0023002193|nr:uncharacterized protein BDF20DRAFT_871856 [Mycotypha africana]KAI8979813.1 hypothetical protein BDF20DRAFT_871856 [Mycotypha africana]
MVPAFFSSLAAYGATESPPAPTRSINICKRRQRVLNRFHLIFDHGLMEKMTLLMSSTIPRPMARFKTALKTIALPKRPTLTWTICAAKMVSLPMAHRAISVSASTLSSFKCLALAELSKLSCNASRTYWNISGVNPR